MANTLEPVGGIVNSWNTIVDENIAGLSSVDLGYDGTVDGFYRFTFECDYETDTNAILNFAGSADGVSSVALAISYTVHYNAPGDLEATANSGTAELARTHPINTHGKHYITGTISHNAATNQTAIHFWSKAGTDATTLVVFSRGTVTHTQQRTLIKNALAPWVTGRLFVERLL